jgi:hypothetical protein
LAKFGKNDGFRVSTQNIGIDNSPPQISLWPRHHHIFNQNRTTLLQARHGSVLTFHQNVGMLELPIDFWCVPKWRFAYRQIRPKNLNSVFLVN